MLHRMIVLTLALGLVIAFDPIAKSSQNDLQMPTTGTISGLQFSNRVTDALDSLATCNSGASAPTNAAGAAPKAGQCWLDTTVGTALKKYIYTGSDWVLEGTLDVTNGIWVPPLGGGSNVLASAGTTSLCSVPQAYINVTGTESITSFGSGCVAGQTKLVRFSAAATLVYDGAALIIPGGLSKTAEAGDTILVTNEGGSNWRVLIYSPASGQAISNPAVPVGTKLDYTGGAVPTNFVLGYGQALLRSSYPDYLAAVTIAQSATRTSGNATLTSVADTSRMGAGMPIEGTGIPAGTTIASVTAGTIVMSANASTSGTSTATVFLHGYGTGGDSTTVGVFNCQGRLVAGRDDMSGSAAGRITTAGSGIDGRAMGATGGAQTVTMAQSALPNVSLTFAGTSDTWTLNTGNILSGGSTNQNVQAGSSQGGVNIGSSPGSVTVTVVPAGTISSLNGGVTQTAVNKMPPVAIADCIIRVIP